MVRTPGYAMSMDVWHRALASRFYRTQTSWVAVTNKRRLIQGIVAQYLNIVCMYKIYMFPYLVLEHCICISFYACTSGLETSNIFPNDGALDNYLSISKSCKFSKWIGIGFVVPPLEIYQRCDNDQQDNHCSCHTNTNADVAGAVWRWALICKNVAARVRPTSLFLINRKCTSDPW